jgi:hypothetical protein
MPTKPFLLVSSNMISTNFLPFHQNIKLLKDAGYFNRDPKLFKKRFYAVSEDFKKLHEFIVAIIYLAENNNGYDIVVRPHPAEDLNTWKIFLEDIPNVHVLRQDSITAWVKNAFGVMHNGCTTALEATVSGKEVFTFNPFDMEYDKKIFNTLGHNLKSKEELLNKVNDIFEKSKFNENKERAINLNNLISKKIYIDENKLAAEKILKVWESLDDKLKSLSQSNNWLIFFCFLKILNIRSAAKNILAKIFPSKFMPIKQNHKFVSLDEKDIQGRVDRLKHVLKIEKKIKCKFLSNRTFLIKSY